MSHINAVRDILAEEIASATANGSASAKRALLRFSKALDEAIVAQRQSMASDAVHSVFGDLLGRRQSHTDDGLLLLHGTGLMGILRQYNSLVDSLDSEFSTSRGYSDSLLVTRGTSNSMVGITHKFSENGEDVYTLRAERFGALGGTSPATQVVGTSRDAIAEAKEIYNELTENALANFAFAIHRGLEVAIERGLDIEMPVVSYDESRVVQALHSSVVAQSA